MEVDKKSIIGKIRPVATAKNVESIDHSMERRTDVRDLKSLHAWNKMKKIGKEEGIPFTNLGEYYIARAIDVLEQWHSKPREGYHITDFVMCPREKVFRVVDRRPIGAKNVGIYSVGKAMHEATQLLFKSDKRMFEIEKYVELEDTDLYIQGSVDIYDRRRNVPLEFKTTRAADIKGPKSFHVEQIKSYMSLLEADQGYIIYQLLMHFGEMPLRYFKITMDAQQRQAQRDKLVNEARSLKKAMEAEDPSLARSINNDPSLNWMCKDCPYSVECKRIENTAVAA
jgi:CRISPR/Cas system-associated exonuclease Cas4 (RecB family)